MSASRRFLIALLLTPLVIPLARLTAGAAQKVTPEEIVKRHLEQAFGPAAPEPRRSADGTCTVSSLMGSGTVDGSFQLMSTPEASRFNLKFGIPTYEGETIVFDGRELEVGFAQHRTSTRSALGMFLSTYPVIVRDGLFGGVLNRRWPLRDLAARDTKLSYDGLKKLDGRELHRVRYRVGRNQGDLTVHLFFEPDTFRHVASVYAASRSQQALSPQPTAFQADERFTVTEHFSGFETDARAGAPGEWLVHYTHTGGRSTEWKYECKVASVVNGS